LLKSFFLYKVNLEGAKELALPLPCEFKLGTGTKLKIDQEGGKTEIQQESFSVMVDFYLSYNFYLRHFFYNQYFRTINEYSYFILRNHELKAVFCVRAKIRQMVPVIFVLHILLSI
jgi:hypothetical protein